MYIVNLFRHWTYQLFAPGSLLRKKYEAFRTLLEYDKKSHELIAELEQIYHDELKVDLAAVERKYEQLSAHVSTVVESLTRICPSRHLDLADYFKKIDFYIRLALAPSSYDFSPPFTMDLEEIEPQSHALVGGKALNLALVRKQLALPVPRGFVITANAYHYFIEFNNLRPSIEPLLAGMRVESSSSLEQTSRELRQLILAARVPEDVEKAMRQAFEAISRGAAGRLKVSVRSSAIGEDSQASFAGQYRTVLNVDADQLVESYKEVVASKYSPRALYYRISYGLSDLETPMAVLVLEMIDARASGVIYTRDPAGETPDRLLIHTIWGLGELLVNGSVAPSILEVSREMPHRIERQEATVQPTKAIFAEGRGTRVVAVKDELAASLALNQEAVSRLAGWSMQLEEFFASPQDIEWCVGHGGELYLLQCRPLQLPEPSRESAGCELPEIAERILLSGGIKASSGIGSGKVFRVESGADLERLPTDAVLVVKTPSPDYVKVIDRLRAVVTEVGSSAGHFPSVAREFGVPTLVNAGAAVEKLVSGEMVTVDADAGVVYEGRVSELLDSGCARRAPLADSAFMKRLRKVLDYISPLNLVDPRWESFSPEGCKTLHDILRFAHEQCIREMFSIGDRASRRARGTKKLVSEIPVIVYLLDLGGGLREEALAKKEVVLEDITSLPLRALWKGLSHPKIHWDPSVVHYNWEEYDRLSASGGLVSPDSVWLGSYAILSHNYLNFNMNFGFHFVVLDTMCSDILDNNYVMLRFVGGGGDLYSRSLRVGFLGEVLSRHGFKVEKKGDLIDARLERDDRETVEARLETLGVVLGCTRVLDMALKDGAQVEEMVEKFMDGIYDISPLSRK